MCAGILEGFSYSLFNADKSDGLITYRKSDAYSYQVRCAVLEVGDKNLISIEAKMLLQL